MAKYRVNSGLLKEGKKTYHTGDVVETSRNLLKRNLRGRPERYTLIEGSVDSGEPKTTTVQDGKTTVTTDDLETRTVAELRQLAADQEIELGSVTKKEEILAVLRNAFDG